MAEKVDGKKLVFEVVFDVKQALDKTETLSEKLEEVEKKNKKIISEESGKKFSNGIDFAIASLRTFNTIYPDTISGIEEIVKQATAAKQAMAAGASAPLAWATSIISVIGIVAEMITSTGEKLKKRTRRSKTKSRRSCRRKQIRESRS